MDTTTKEPIISLERTRCEIWTRVMGYHRPVSQFNKGKKSEFYSRTYFKETSPTQRFIDTYGGVSEAKDSLSKTENHDIASYLLFTTTTCQKCPAIKSWVENTLGNVPGQHISNSNQAFYDLAEKYEVLAAPTIIFFNATGEELMRGDDLSEIEAFFSDHSLCA